LMGVHDIKTMNMISDELHKINPGILLYGEGWTAGGSPLPDSARALKKNAYKLHNIAVFSDDIRDGIKGSVFDIKDRGFASGKAGMEESVKFGIVAATNHPQVDLSKVNYSKAAYAKAPWNVISYCECHDNNVLWDKLLLSNPGASKDDLVKMHQLALTIVLTSQGIPFLHAGTEFLRSKKGVENSYNAGDSINAIDWSLKNENNSTYQLVQHLIKLKKEHPAFRLTTAEAIQNNIRFQEDYPEGTIVYTLNGAAVKDKWKTIFIAFNGTDEEKLVRLPAGKWSTFSATNSALRMTDGKLALTKYSATILYRK
jgi:pullulanase